jgi:hypothetical protein
MRSTLFAAFSSGSVSSGLNTKTERKILLKNLSGNSAFKNGAPPKVEEVTADE